MYTWVYMCIHGNTRVHMDINGDKRVEMDIHRYTIQLSPEGKVNSGGYIPRREASRYISTALHQP